MRLLPLLFENIDPTQVMAALKAGIKCNYSCFPPAIWRHITPEELYALNKGTFDKILVGATEFYLLGSGTEGSAFSLGDKVLKIAPNTYRADCVDAWLSPKVKKRDICSNDL